MLGERLIRLRKAKNWTQTDLAHECGVSRNSIVNWETDKREPKISDIQKLAEVFGVSPNDLIGKENHVGQNHANLDKTTNPEPESFAYWGGVLDRTRNVVERGDMQEINAITPLLQIALNMLLSVGEHITSHNAGVIPTVSAYNGDHSSYTGNTLTMGNAPA